MTGAFLHWILPLAFIALLLLMPHGFLRCLHYRLLVSYLLLLLLLMLKGLLSLLLVLMMMWLLQGLMPCGGISRMVVISLTMEFSSATRSGWGQSLLTRHNLVKAFHRSLG